MEKVVMVKERSCRVKLLLLSKPKLVGLLEFPDSGGEEKSI